MKKNLITNKINISLISRKLKQSFFGYYDKSPWDKNEEFILSLETGFIDHNPIKEKADIVLINLKKKGSKKLAQTRAWNWQQGCMLQWMPPNYKKKIIYNDFRNDKFVSVILDINTSKRKIIPHPVYCVHPSGNYALSLNFSRLYDVRRSYGYSGLKDKNYNQNAPDEDGIFLINLRTGKKKLIISLKQLSEFRPLQSMKDKKQWVNHIMFNPRGDRFCFFHRWEISPEISYTRLFTSDLDGNLYLLPDTGFYSHIIWKNNKELLGWATLSKKMGNLRKSNKKMKFIIKYILPLYRKIVPKKLRKSFTDSDYVLLEDKTQKINRIKIYNQDGHSSFSPNKRFIITDTYPDKDNYRRLLLYDVLKKMLVTIGKFYSIPDKKYLKKHIENFGNSEVRCDLHPRWGPNGKKICIDSVHEGFRGIYEINLKNYV